LKASAPKYKRTALALIFIVFALVLLTLPMMKFGEVPYTWLTIGRFHPVILHFPIVLIIVAFLLEILRRVGIGHKGDRVVTIILVAAAISTVVAIASGYLLYASGDYAGNLLQQHLWLGTITGVLILATVGCYFIAKNFTRLYPLYVAGLLASNGAVAYTSHLGGSLTHGEEYLTEYFPLMMNKQTSVAAKPDSAMLLYDDLLQPVLQAKCLSCHNDARAKGEYSMTSLQNMMKGGESGKAGLVPGYADSSEMYRRLLLPEDDDDRMPPKGKTPMTAAETELVRYWIAAGANAGTYVKDIKKDATISAAVAAVEPELKKYKRRQEIAKHRSVQLKRSLDTLARQLNVSISRDTTADEDDLYVLTMKFPPARFSGDQMRELAPFGDVFSKLSLVSSGVEDEGLYHIAQMPNVKALYLQKTNIKGSGIVHLQGMTSLEVLNLSYTGVDDKAALDLLKIPNLREVYLFQTRTSPDVIKALQAYKPSLRILMEEGPYL
jgi:uncharacterized membrane protein